MGWLQGITINTTVPSFATADEVAAIKQHLPTKPILYESEAGMNSVVTVTGDLPRELTEPLTTRISNLLDEAIKFRRENVAILDDPYEVLAHEDQYVKLDIADVVRRLFDKDLSDLNEGAQVAVHHSLTRHLDKIIIRMNKVQDTEVILTPRHLVKKTEQVVGWARDYQECAALAARGQNMNKQLRENPLNAFIERARRLILKSRKTRSPTTLGVLGPSSARVQTPGEIELISNGETFSDDDKKIIEFIWDTLLRLPISVKKSRTMSISSMILRAVGAYPNMRLSRTMGRLFLQELGTIPPWSEFSDEKVTLPIPGRRGADVADQLFEESERLAVDLGFRQETSNEPVPMIDRYKHLRKDWGDMEVFLIDSPDSTTLDDGISIEASDVEADAYWLHVHTAHPAAFFEPDHVFGKRSSHFSQSIYSSRAVYPMLPFSAARTMSIGPKKEVLTISTLILSSGEVKNIKVSLGIVHNTIRLDASDVLVLGGNKTYEQALLIVGPDVFGRRDPLPILADIKHHEETLKKMLALVRQRAQHRQRSVPDAPSFWRPTSRSDHSVSSIEDWDASRLFESYQYAGDPSIKISGSRGPTHVRVSDDLLNIGLVEGSMVLAGETLGRWLCERNIPAVYNGATTSEEYPLWRLNKADKYDDISAAVAVTSSTPIPHAYMALNEYCRVTSPLRRFTDLVNQWQITSALDREASNTSTPVNPQVTEATDDPPTSRTDLTFTKSEIDTWISSHLATQSAINTLGAASYTHWALQALFRAHHFRAAPLPTLFDCQVYAMRVRSSSDREESGIKGVLWPFKITANFLKSEEGFEERCARGQFLPCRIVTVDVMKQEVRVRAVGGPSWELTQYDEKGWVVRSGDGDKRPDGEGDEVKGGVGKADGESAEGEGG